MGAHTPYVGVNQHALSALVVLLCSLALAAAQGNSTNIEFCGHDGANDCRPVNPGEFFAAVGLITLLPYLACCGLVTFAFYQENDTDIDRLGKELLSLCSCCQGGSSTPSRSTTPAPATSSDVPDSAVAIPVVSDSAGNDATSIRSEGSTSSTIGDAGIELPSTRSHAPVSGGGRGGLPDLKFLDMLMCCGPQDAPDLPLHFFEDGQTTVSMVEQDSDAVMVAPLNHPLEYREVETLNFILSSVGKEKAAVVLVPMDALTSAVERIAEAGQVVHEGMEAVARRIFNLDRTRTWVFWGSDGTLRWKKDGDEHPFHNVKPDSNWSAEGSFRTLAITNSSVLQVKSGTSPVGFALGMLGAWPLTPVFLLSPGTQIKLGVPDPEPLEDEEEGGAFGAAIARATHGS